MFNADFFPTPPEVIERMLEGFAIDGKTFWEPEVGKGDIVQYIQDRGGFVIGCENDPNLKLIAKTKCKLIAEDMLTVTSDMISHIDYVIMNPPFSKAPEHILHAFTVAPAGCKIVSLINSSNLENTYTEARKQVKSLVESYGSEKKLGECFSTSERTTSVKVSLLTIQKAGSNYNVEFEGFFMDDDPEEEQGFGIMPYNVVRDLVNRYIAAVKLFDSHLATGLQMHSLLAGFYGDELTFTCTAKGAPKLRNEFKKDLQKAGWKFIFAKMNMEKYSTRGLKEDINKFVEKQTEIPFTMRNIYHMLDIVIGTQGQRMDKALVEVFDRLTQHHDENRFAVEGWKTNSHYLVNKKFILPGMCYQDQRWYKGSKIQVGYGTNFELMEDLVKALCYITGDKYESLGSLKDWMNYRYKIKTPDDIFHHGEPFDSWNGPKGKIKELYEAGIQNELVDNLPEYGEWFEWAYFRCKAFKKGSMHFEFLSEDLWAKFNQRVGKIKGFPLYEPKKQTKYEKRDTSAANPVTKMTTSPQQSKVLFTAKVPVQ